MTMDKSSRLKPLHWIGSSKRDLKALPKPVEDLFGFALYLAQVGCLTVLGIAD
jgi:phage-related protein